ncbi:MULTISPECIES: hypothetical protein [Ramlibacter]|uniref:Type 4 fimbrial biogenesis protein PilX N-terminal domain-containing protein n=1 Tax=Ramlibacter aquaticus TaxID=2780094 RepID=A0ABR9SHY9_9BURK|nr:MULTISPECIES: hypothetical protein [Ramlibacter]MBE7941970.1 hypothetical protein [Ramlibacter aquaticus]
MKRSISARGQRGITLIVGLILLILITLMVTTAFTLNTTNLKAVGNMQFRNEVISAANRAVEVVIGSSFPTGFTSLPPQQTLTLNINNDANPNRNPDYSVTVFTPTCLSATTVTGGSNSSSCGGFRAGGLAGCQSSTYSSLWQIDATVTDSVTGAQVTLTQGFRQEISAAQKAAVCP